MTYKDFQGDSFVPPMDHHKSDIFLSYHFEPYKGGAIEVKELPFVIGIVADLSGKPEEPLACLRERRSIQIDRDNFDDVLKGMKPRLAFKVENKLTVDGSSMGVELRFNEMEGFEPTSVVNQVPQLRALLDLRTKLADLRNSLNDQLESLLQEMIHSPESLQKVVTELRADEIPTGGLVDRIITEGYLAQYEEDKESAKAWLQEFFSLPMNDDPPLSKNIESMLANRICHIDHKLSVQLNEIMHAPEFQQLEASWRGLQYLVSWTKSSSPLMIRVLNISKEDLRKDLEQAVELGKSAFFRKVYNEEYEMFGGAPYGALIGDYYFGRSAEDIGLLEKISNVASAANAPFIAAASPSLFGWDSFTELDGPRDLSKIFDNPDYYEKWKSFRMTEDSQYVGLVLPRFLLRLPYGKNTVPVEALDYQEDVDGRDHSKYLWGNSAYAFATRLAKAFHRYGWCAAIRGVETGGLISGLPVHKFVTRDGDITVKCPTEVVISDRRQSELAALGFITLCHIKRSDMATFVEVPACARLKQYDTEDENIMAAFSVRLEYTIAISRFMHYLKVIVRDSAGVLSRLECEQFLNRWMNEYILVVDPGSDAVKAKIPLRHGRVEVTEIPDRPGSYRVVAFLQPHFQLHHLTVPLRFETELPAPARR